MLGNFEYYNPTKLYFGEQALDGLRKELPKYGKNVLLVYGGGSIQKNGIYDQVVSILQECGKTIVRKTRGKSSIFALKSQKTKLFRWAVC